MSFLRTLKRLAPWPARFLYRKLRDAKDDFAAAAALLSARPRTPVSRMARLRLILKCYRISYSVECPHTEAEMFRVMRAIFALDPALRGAVVEAGAYKGGSTAKISLAARLAKRKLIVFDSFEGIPPHDEDHSQTNVYGGDAHFHPGDYKGTLEEVRLAVARYGDLGVCEFKKGWFRDTMPGFKDPVGVAYVDVDLESSTRTSVQYLYQLLVPGGTLFSQDGHLPWVIRLLKDEEFWRRDVGTPKPNMRGLGTEKLVEILKRAGV